MNQYTTDTIFPDLATKTIAVHLAFSLHHLESQLLPVVGLACPLRRGRFAGSKADGEFPSLEVEFDFASVALSSGEDWRLCNMLPRNHCIGTWIQLDGRIESRHEDDEGEDELTHQTWTRR